MKIGHFLIVIFADIVCKVWCIIYGTPGIIFSVSYMIHWVTSKTFINHI